MNRAGILVVFLAAWSAGLAFPADVEAPNGGRGAGTVPLWNPHRPAAENQPLTVRVLVLNYDPLVPAEGYRRLSEVFRWNNPAKLATDCKEASEYAASRGIIIADTKFEFGLNGSNELVLIDEVLTADSSRFWPKDSYQVGISPPSYDKQFVRDYLETLDWNKEPPAPKLPPDVIARTSEKYREALQRLTGRALS